MKKYLIFLILVSAFAYFFFKRGEGNCQKIETINQQENQIEIQHETIETKVFQQKIISKPANSIDLAARQRWLQLVKRERGYSL